MPLVAKKKSIPERTSDAAPELPPDSILVRLPDPSLALVLEEYARRTRRSRNLAIVVLLEDAMRQAGLWPPAASDPDDA